MAADGRVFEGKKVLVTGGLGVHSDSNLATRLVGFGADVLLVDSLIPEYGGNLFNIAGLADDVHVNISDARETSTAWPTSSRARIICSTWRAKPAISTRCRTHTTDLEINARAQLSILECCRKYNPGLKIVFASTRQIYGKPEALPVNESHPLRPVDVNGIHKMAGECYHLLYHTVYGIRSCVLRLTNTYGPPDASQGCPSDLRGSLDSTADGEQTL